MKLDLLRGFKGHPLHPPLTDVSVGAYTVGTILAVVGWLGFKEDKLAWGAFLATSVGLISALPVVLTGLADYLQIPRGTQMRRTANLHWMTMVAATAVYSLDTYMLKVASDAGTISSTAALLSVAAFILLTFGGYVGGAIVFHYGMRVQNSPVETPMSEALKPKWPPD